MAKEQNSNGNIYGFRSQADKQRDKALNTIQSMTFALLILFAINICLNIVTLTTTLNRSEGTATGTSGEWIELTTANNVGYMVRSSWSATSIDDALVFQPTDTTAITIQAQDLETLNAMGDLKCTADTLLEYVQESLAALSSATADLAILNVAYKEYTVLDTRGYYITYTQTQVIEEVTSSAYVETLYFVYNSYLYCFSYAAGYKGVSSADFNTVIQSIRIAPEEENDMIELDINNKPDTSSALEEFSELLPDDVTTSTDTNSTASNSTSTGSDVNSATSGTTITGSSNSEE